MCAWIGEDLGFRLAALKVMGGKHPCSWGGRQRWAWSLPTPPELQFSRLCMDTCFSTSGAVPESVLMTSYT